MGSINHFKRAYDQFKTPEGQSDQYIQDPGAGGTFDLRGIDNGYAVIASGTRVVPDNIPKGVRFTVYATGNVTITSAAAVTVSTLTTGQYAEFRPLTLTTWAAQRGVTGAGGTGSAALVGIADAAGYTTTTNVETQLQELALANRIIEVPMYGILAAGTPMAAFANDNSNPAPGITIATRAMGIRWNNAATQNAPVWFSVPMPTSGFDASTTFVPTLHILAAKTGATTGDATSFTVVAARQTVGTIYDADSSSVADNGSTGGVSTSMTGNATAKTVQEVTLAFSDLVGTLPKMLSMSVTPTTGTLGTDDLIIHRMWFTY